MASGWPRFLNHAFLGGRLPRWVFVLAVTLASRAACAQTVYDFSTGAGVDRFAYGTYTNAWLTDLEGQRQPCPQLCTEVTSVSASAYLQMAASDAIGGDLDANRYTNPTLSGGDEASVIFEFNIAEAPANVLQLDIVWEGYGDANRHIELYIWNDTVGNWGNGRGGHGENAFVAEGNGNFDVYLTGSVTENVSDYISPTGQVTLLVYMDSSVEEIFHDYVKLTVWDAACQVDADCDDAIACTADRCLGGFCYFEPDDVLCGDGNVCNGLETCEAATGNCLPGPCGSETIILSQGFDADAGSLVYQDDAFRATTNAAVSSGAFLAQGGRIGGGLGVTLGPFGTGISGGWGTSFDVVGSPSSVALTVVYRLILDGSYEAAEYSEALLSVDGTLVADAPNDYLERIYGDGNNPADPMDTWWVSRTFQLSLAPGTHQLVVGAYNSGSSAVTEVTHVYFDDIRIAAFYDEACDCNDGLFCNGTESCVAEVCVVGSPPCPLQTCDDVVDACVPCVIAADCDDGLYCNGAEVCDGGGICQPGAVPNCDDGVVCTDDSCDEVGDTCTNTTNDLNCPDDGLFCTGAEYCDAVLDCTTTGFPCTTGFFCNETTDTCDPGCALDTECDDSDPCTADTCNTGVCTNAPNGQITAMLAIQGLTNTVTRDVTFVMTTCGGSVDTRSVPVSFDATGVGTAVLGAVDANAGWLSVVEGHTLRRLVPLAFVACEATPSLTGGGELPSGSFQVVGLAQDNFVDITDFSILAARWNDPVDASSALGADATGDGVQASADFAAIQVNFLSIGDAIDGCPAGATERFDDPVAVAHLDPADQITRATPRLTLPVAELAAWGGSNSHRADLNRDGVVDVRDLRAFALRYGLPINPRVQRVLTNMRHQGWRVRR